MYLNKSENNKKHAKAGTKVGLSNKNSNKMTTINQLFKQLL